MRRVVPVCLALALCAVAQVTPKLFAGLQWRNLGTFRGGRMGAVCGVPGHPGIYYVGAIQGGMWKSVSAGAVWVNITDTTVPEVAGIAACAVAASDSNVVYFSSNARGPGMYRSGDAGKSWQHVGPQATAILVDPHDPDLVLVSRGGAEGGVYRTSNGGRDWTRTFAGAAGLGAGAVAWAADDPSQVFASAGGRGGRGAAAGATVLYHSTDEGQTWTTITPTGLPALGPFTVAGSTQAQRLYSIGRGGLYRSDDGGHAWTETTSKVYTAGSNIYTDPKNPDLVYVLGTAVYRSTDGGHSIEPFKGAPGGDDPREWWIDPTDGHSILYGGDQGASVSLDAGLTWSPWYNQPTAQLYHLTVDDRFPYWVYGSQQDSGITATKNRGDFGQINPFDWVPFPGWEGSTMAVDPLDPNVVYANGNYGDLERVWMNTWDSQIVNPGVGHDIMRRNSNSPIVFSPQDPHVLYFVTQYVMRSRDGAETFERMSPDLTVPSGAQARPSPAEPPTGRTAPRGGPAIISFALSPVEAGVMWAGAPGVLSTSADGGGHWRNVTPADWRAGVNITNIEASHFDAKEAYVVVDKSAAGFGAAPGTGDDRPYLYRTRDGGGSWQLIVNGLPTDESTGSFVRVVREDPKQRGLLFAGTETQVHVSFDDGDHWQSLRLNAPNTSWRDLVIHGDDLVAATYGRSFWVLDDMTPLRRLASQAQAIAAAPAYLYPPDDAVRLQRDNNYDTPIPPEVPHALNPPDGAVLYYNLAAAAQGEVRIEIFDAAHHLVRTLSSHPPPLPPDPLGAAPEPWKRSPEPLPTSAGMHRVNWDLRWGTPPALSFNYDQVMSAIYGDTPPTPQGPKAVPGQYTVQLTVNGQTYTRPLRVTEDPRLDANKVTVGGMQRQLDLELKLRDDMEATKTGFDQVAAVREQLKAAGSATAAAGALDAKLAELQGLASAAVSGAYGVTASRTPAFSNLNGQIAGLAVIVDYNSDMPPVAAQVQAWRDFCGDTNTALAQWRSLLQGELASVQPRLQLAQAPAALSCE